MTIDQIKTEISLLTEVMEHCGEDEIHLLKIEMKRRIAQLLEAIETA